MSYLTLNRTLNTFLKQNPVVMNYKIFLKKLTHGNIKVCLTQLETRRRLSFVLNSSIHPARHEQVVQTIAFNLDKSKLEGNLSLNALSHFEIVLRSLEIMALIAIHQGYPSIQVNIDQENQGLLAEPEFMSILFDNIRQYNKSVLLQGNMQGFLSRAAVCHQRYQKIMWNLGRQPAFIVSLVRELKMKKIQ